MKNTPNLETLLLRVIDQQQDINLRLTELEVDQEADRQRRKKADDDLMVLLLRGDAKLKANIDYEGMEKYNHSLSNSLEI
jgi:hypothetical protein